MNKRKQEIRDELLSSPTSYCCYCLSRKRGKISCCDEVHFVPFSDLYEDQQEELINGFYDDEEWG